MIEKGSCIVWVGSGLSQIAEYPGWKETIRELCDKCSVKPLSESEEVSANKLIDKAEECKKADINTYHDTLATLFGKPAVGTRLAYQFLMKLPFKAYVTTNFDPLLSEAGAIEGYDIYSYPIFPDEFGNSHPIVYVHGLARKKEEATGKNLILASSDFDEAYKDIGLVNNFVVHIFTHYPLLFLGCSLTEPVMYEVFQKVHRIHTLIKGADPHAILPRRCIVLPKQKRVNPEFSDEKIEEVYTREENKRFDEMEIEVMRYEPINWLRQEEIEYILRRLCEYTKSSKNVFGKGEVL